MEGRDQKVIRLKEKHKVVRYKKKERKKEREKERERGGERERIRQTDIMREAMR